MIELRDKYGEERRTEIIEGELSRATMEELIAEETNAVTLSHNGYIKRLPLNTYRTQHRGGKGVSGGAAREDDWIEHFFVASTHAYLLCFTNRGQMYWLKVYEIPEMSRTSAGRAIANVLSLKEDEKITSVIPVRRFDTTSFLLMATRKAKSRRRPCKNTAGPRPAASSASTWRRATRSSMSPTFSPATRFSCARAKAWPFASPRAMPARWAATPRVSKASRLMEGDAVVGMVIADPDGALLTVCANGYGKRTPFGPNTSRRQPKASRSRLEEMTDEEPAEEPIRRDNR